MLSVVEDGGAGEGRMLSILQSASAVSVGS